MLRQTAPRCPCRKERQAWCETLLGSSFASTRQMHDLLKISDTLRIPRLALVGDTKQLGAVGAGKPFAQLQHYGMQVATMNEIVRQRNHRIIAGRLTLYQGRHCQRL